MDSIQALNYLTSETFTGGNGILEIEATICKEIIEKELTHYRKIKEKIQNSIAYLTKELKYATATNNENAMFELEDEINSLKDLLG